MSAVLDQTEFFPFFSPVDDNQTQTTNINLLYAISDTILFTDGLFDASGITEHALTSQGLVFLDPYPSAIDTDDNQTIPQPKMIADTPSSATEQEEPETQEPTRELDRNLWQFEDLQPTADNNMPPAAVEDDILPAIFMASILRLMQPNPGDIDINSAQPIENALIDFLPLDSAENPVIDNDGRQDTDANTEPEWCDTDSAAVLETVVDSNDTSINNKPILSLLPSETLAGYLPEPIILTALPQISARLTPMHEGQNLTDTAPIDESITHQETLQLIGQSFEETQIIWPD